jgi:hypothetical protein
MRLLEEATRVSLNSGGQVHHGCASHKGPISSRQKCDAPVPSAAATLTGNGSGVPSAFAAVSAFWDAAGVGALFCWLPDLWIKHAFMQRMIIF